MNMDETKLYSWFLGPKAENADMLERLVLEALRDCVFWRRNFHPEDDIIITEKCKREDAFQDSQALVRQEFLALLANLKRDIPFYSPRYIGHMLGDQLCPPSPPTSPRCSTTRTTSLWKLRPSPRDTRWKWRATGRADGLFGRDLGAHHFRRDARQFRGALGGPKPEVFPIAARDAARLALEDCSHLPRGRSIS